MSSFVEFDPPENRRYTDPAIEVVVHKLTRMASDMDKMAGSVEKLSESMARLVLVEERIGQTTVAIDRLHKHLDKLTESVSKLERENITNNRTSTWFDKGLFAVVAVFFTYVASKLGLIK
jgi:predicted nuclease with TOPRIM domain